MRSLQLLGLGAILAAAGCDSAEPDFQEERVQLLTSLAEDTLIPQYERTHAALGDLVTATENLCATPSAALLDEAKSAWDAARSAWKQSEVFAFGPYKTEPLRLGPKVDSWPVRTQSVDGLLQTGEEAISPDLLGRSGVFLRGFPVIEYLLYYEGEVETLFAPGTRHCEYVVSAASDAQTTVSRLIEAWEPQGGNYIATFAGADEEPGYFEDSLEALSEVVNRLGFTAENAHAERLTPALGADTPSGPDATLLESQFSGRSASDIADHLRGLEAVFFGEGEALGVRFYLDLHGLDHDEEMRTLLSNAHAALDAISLPLSQAIHDEPEAVQTAIDAMKELQRFIQGTVIPELGFSVGFNDTDGD